MTQQQPRRGWCEPPLRATTTTTTARRLTPHGGERPCRVRARPGEGAPRVQQRGLLGQQQPRWLPLRCLRLLLRLLQGWRRTARLRRLRALPPRRGQRATEAGGGSALVVGARGGVQRPSQLRRRPRRPRAAARCIIMMMIRMRMDLVRGDAGWV